MEHGEHNHAIEILFHPYLVHFPIAFFLLEGALVLLWVWKRDERYLDFSFLAFKFAVFSMPFVMLAGYVDSGGIVPVVRWHFISAVTLLALGIIRYVLRVKIGETLWRGPSRSLAFVLLGLQVALTLLTGHLGGLMVYF